MEAVHLEQAIKLRLPISRLSPRLVTFRAECQRWQEFFRPATRPAPSALLGPRLSPSGKVTPRTFTASPRQPSGRRSLVTVPAVRTYGPTTAHPLQSAPRHGRKVDSACKTNVPLSLAGKPYARDVAVRK